MAVTSPEREVDVFLFFFLKMNLIFKNKRHDITELAAGHFGGNFGGRGDLSLDSGARQLKRKASGSFSSDRGDGKDGDDDARAVDRRRHQPRFLE